MIALLYVFSAAISPRANTFLHRHFAIALTPANQGAIELAHRTSPLIWSVLFSSLRSRLSRHCQACPTNAPTPSPTPTPGLQAQSTCTCESRFCAQMWPQSCYCANENKQRCFDKCGGEQPELQVFIIISFPLFIFVVSEPFPGVPSSGDSCACRQSHRGTSTKAIQHTQAMRRWQEQLH